MARKRVGYTVTPKGALEFDLFAPDNPQARLLECGKRGDVTSDAYKAALADFKAAEEQGAPMGRLYRRVTKAPVVWELPIKGGSCAVYNPLDTGHLNIVEFLFRNDVHTAMAGVAPDEVCETLATFKVGCATLVAPGLYRLGAKGDAEKD